MLAQIITENGQKKVIPLTADAGAGNPVGTIIPMYKKSSPSGYLYCDGSTFDETKYHLLYAYLGSNVLPDYREFALVGAEENTTDVYNASTNPNGTIHDHDVYTEGQSKDDQLQDHAHSNGFRPETTSGDRADSLMSGSNQNTQVSNLMIQSVYNARNGTVTRGKRKAVYFYIKATSGLSENAQDNVVAQLNEQRSYSTEEHLTGRKWIDGKPTYEKTIDCGALPNIATKQVAHNITNIDEVIVIKGNAKDTSGTRLALPFTSAYDINNSIQVTVSDTNIGIYAGSNRSSYNGYITLEYTKTND